MKKVKLITMTLLVMMTTLSFSQTDTLTHEMVENAKKRPKGKYLSYVSKDGRIYLPGDTINIGMPSGTNGRFIHLQKMDLAGTVYIIGAEAVNTHIILKKIRVGGTKRSGWKVSFQTKGMTAVDNYFLYIEDAITTGEIDSGVMSSDKALEELKRAKDKLDLGLITQKEFDKIREELSKYIK